MLHKTICLLFLVCALSSFAAAQTVVELSPEQSMCITGKGPGQDAAINPYINERSISVVTNLGRNALQVRIQRNGELIKIQEVPAKKEKEFTLEKGYELYFDCDDRTSAKVAFRPYKTQ